MAGEARPLDPDRGPLVADHVETSVKLRYHFFCDGKGRVDRCDVRKHVLKVPGPDYSGMNVFVGESESQSQDDIVLRRAINWPHLQHGPSPPEPLHVGPGQPCATSCPTRDAPHRLADRPLSYDADSSGPCLLEEAVPSPLV